MASVVECYPISPPTGRFQGTKTPSYTATWYVLVNDVVPGARVIELAATSGVGTPLPRLGDSLNWTSPAGERYRDASALALDFSPTMLTDAHDDPRAWSIEVTWREPEPGQDEQPGTANLPPLQREPEYWIEYGHATVDQTEAQEVTDYAAGTLDTKKIMATSASEPFPPISRMRLRPVIVIAKNVASPTAALNLNEDYEHSINSVPFTLLGRTIAKHHARYILTDSGQVRYFQGFPYYRQHTRIEIAKEPYYLRRFNAGTYYFGLTDVTARTFKDAEGHIINGQIPLKTDGDLATTVEQYNNKYFMTYDLADFRKLF